MALKSQKRIQDIKNNLTAEKITQVAYNYFKGITPQKSGNAKRHTTMSKNEIRANYPYAKRLDEGYSKQAPKGMVNPTIEFIRAYIKKQLGK
jgi:hypothetical protein